MPDKSTSTWEIPRTPTPRIVGGLFRCRNYIWENDHRLVEAHGITWSQFLVLTELRGAGDAQTLAPTELMEAAQVTSGGLTKMLHALTDAGLVRRVPHSEDKRSTLVQLLPKGAVLTETIVAELIKVNTELFASILSDKECEDLAVLLGKLRQGLEGKYGRGKYKPAK